MKSQGYKANGAKHVMESQTSNPQNLMEVLNNALANDGNVTFATHFDMFANRKSASRFDIDFEEVWRWIGYSRKSTAIRILHKYFSVDADYITEADQDMKRDRVMMSESAFKEFCIISNTEKGRQVRDYYCRVEVAMFDYLKDVIERDWVSFKTRLKQDNELARQKSLMNVNAGKKCVFVCRVSDINDSNEYLVKFGKTSDIKSIVKHMANEYDVCILVEVIATDYQCKLKQHILQRPIVQRHRVEHADIIKLNANFTLADFTKLIKDSARQIEESNLTITQKVAKCVLDLELDDNTKATILQHVLVDGDEDSSCKTPETLRYRRVYKYTPDNLATPIETFQSLRQASRSTNNDRIRDYHIRNAADTNTIAADHRWYFVDESEDNPNMLPPSSIPETVLQPEQKKNSGLVAQVDETKTKVLKVHKSTKDAAADVKVSACSISVAKQQKQRVKGCYWVAWDDLDQEVKDTYHDPLPEPLKPTTCSKRVQKRDAATLEVLEEFPCIQDVVNKYRICHKKLKQLSESGDIYKGFVWSLVKD